MNTSLSTTIVLTSILKGKVCMSLTRREESSLAIIRDPDPPVPLWEVLQKIPNLRQSCASALSNQRHKNSGINRLRLVSKQMSEAVMQDVEGCCFKIRSHRMYALSQRSYALHRRAAWNFPCDGQIQRLRVELDDEESHLDSKGTGTEDVCPLSRACQLCVHKLGEPPTLMQWSLCQYVPPV